MTCISMLFLMDCSQQIYYRKAISIIFSHKVRSISFRSDDTTFQLNFSASNIHSENVFGARSADFNFVRMSSNLVVYLF